MLNKIKCFFGMHDFQPRCTYGPGIREHYTSLPPPIIECRRCGIDKKTGYRMENIQ